MGVIPWPAECSLATQESGARKYYYYYYYYYYHHHHHNHHHHRHRQSSPSILSISVLPSFCSSPILHRFSFLTLPTFGLLQIVLFPVSFLLLFVYVLIFSRFYTSNLSVLPLPTSCLHTCFFTLFSTPPYCSKYLPIFPSSRSLTSQSDFKSDLLEINLCSILSNDITAHSIR
jgi:hypothetical protein